ncbi:MAG: hypothetical protein JWN40_1680 [Phycisphaerales bacterium]|nr:hypothetical protein [Phycisphaerales bacterium]
MSRSIRRFILVMFILSFMLPSLALARAPKKYQVTGKVLELTDDVIVVEKGDEKWEIGREAATKVDGKLKVGVKVTIEYTMTAAKVDVKDEKAAEKAK